MDDGWKSGRCLAALCASCGSRGEAGTRGTPSFFDGVLPSDNGSIHVTGAKNDNLLDIEMEMRFYHFIILHQNHRSYH